MVTGTDSQDHYLREMYDGSIGFVDGVRRIFGLIFREPALVKSPISELPLTKYFSAPMGEMVARTGWTMGTSSDSAVMFMRIGGSFFHGHQHRDMGTFQIYYKGPLATNSGIYHIGDTSPGTDH